MWYFFFGVSNFKFIYLERENTAAQVVSRMRAETTGDWGVPIEYEIPIRAPFRIEPSVLKAQIDSMRLSNRFALEVIGRFKPLMLTYEGLFEADGAFSENVLRDVAKISELDPTQLKRSPLLKKQAGPSFLDQVENKDEIIEYFRGTSYESMFEHGGP